MAGTVCIRLPINKDESLFGYLARVAEANGYDRSTWLLPIGQTTWFDTSKWTSDTIKHVARITGLAPHEVAVRLYADIGNDKVTFFGDRIRSILIDQRGQKAARKFCPDCLCETGFHSTLFDLVPIQVCPQHACRLTDTCPHCNKKVFWGQPSLVTCLACGGDLRAFKTEKLPVGELRGLTAVAKRFGYPHQHPHLAKQNLALADELAHLSTGEILELVITLAGYLGRRSNNCASFLTFTPEMRTNAHLVLNTRLPFVQRWPEGLFEFLDLYSLARGQTIQRANGLVKSFGRFYLSLIGQTEEPWLTVKAGFADFIENHWTGVSIPRSKLPDKKSAGNGRITIVETCRILGLPPPKVHDLIKPSTDSVNPKERWRGTPIFAGPQDIEKIASNGEKPLLLAELCQALGLTRRRQRQFLKGNVITPVLGPTIDGSPFYLFNAAQSNDILDDFTKWLTERPSGGSLPCTFDDVLKSQSLRQIPVKMVIDAIRSGRLAPIGKSDDKRGLFAFLFDRKTATRILSELQIEHSFATRAFSSEADTGSRKKNTIKQDVTDVFRFHGIGERSSSNMTIALTAMHLRMCQSAVSGMLDAGFLEIALQAPRAKRITIESIEAFKRRYVKTSVLVEEHGTKAQFITERLKAIGIEKASMSSGGMAYTSFYEREKRAGPTNLDSGISGVSA
jgi:hypothetical protein